VGKLEYDLIEVCGSVFLQANPSTFNDKVSFRSGTTAKVKLRNGRSWNDVAGLIIIEYFAFGNAWKNKRDKNFATRYVSCCFWLLLIATVVFDSRLMCDIFKQTTRRFVMFSCHITHNMNNFRTLFLSRS